MKLIKKVLTFSGIGATLILASCANEAPWSANDKVDGKISLSLQADSKIEMGTRADNQSPLVPNPMEFSISLKSTDGSYNQTWKTLGAFNSEEGFPMGSYHISASFGDMDTEGFDKPYFYGESSVTVLKGEESPVSITATLANAMISIRYTDEFSKFFPGYSGIVTTEGHDPVVFVQNESRPAYISVGKANLKLTLTNSSNNTVTVSPASFNVEPRKHYIVTFGVEGNTNIGDATLSIEWSENVVSEEREIPLSEELFTTDPPSVTLEGFNQTSILFEGIEYEGINPEFHVVALGGLDEAILKLSTSDNGQLPISFNEIDLMKADNSSNLLLKNAGIEISGLSDKSVKFAVLNFKEYVKKLTPGTYKATLEVSDLLGRPCEVPGEFNISIKGVEYRFLSYVKPAFLDNEIEVIVETNCEDLKDQLVFKTSNSLGNYVDVKSAQLISETKPESPVATLDYAYTFKLTLDNPIDDCVYSVQTQASNKTPHALNIDVIMPQFNVDIDAFAKKVKIRPAFGTSTETIEILLNYGSLIEEDKMLVEDLKSIYENGMFIVEGLTHEKNYDYTLNIGRSVYEGYKGNVSFTTEKAREIPNGGFENEGQVYSGTLNQGGTYTVTLLPVPRQNTASYSFFEPEGWATTNNKTMNGKTTVTTADNTWFVQPSVFNSNLSYTSINDGNGVAGDGNSTPVSYSNLAAHSGNVAMAVRNVAWDSNYSKISQDTHLGATYENYFSRNVPTLQFKSVGKLFLGSYSYNSGNEKYDLGISFESRPSRLTGYYIYTPDSGDTSDKGKVTVIVYHNEEILAEESKNLEACLNYLPFDIDLNYKDSDFGKKATKVCVLVESSQYGSMTDMSSETNNLRVTTYNSRFESYQHGSTLLVDDFVFEY